MSNIITDIRSVIIPIKKNILSPKTLYHKLIFFLLKSNKQFRDKKTVYITYEEVILLKNFGIKNEYDFVEYFNGKYFNELDNKSQEFLLELFNKNITSDEIIVAVRWNYIRESIEEFKKIS